LKPETNPISDKYLLNQMSFRRKGCLG